MATGIREYTLTDGWTVLVGKTDEDNDHLTFRVAAQNDLWFHVRGCAGSHVVLRAREGMNPPPRIIEAAAAIAAYHSKARSAGKVPVVYTPAKLVSKPKRAKPGTVTLKREKKVRVVPGLPPGENEATEDEVR